MNHFKELQKHYANWLQTLGFSSHTVYGYPKMLHYFLEYLKNKGVYHITGLTQTHIYDYFNHLQTRPNMRSNTALSTSHLNKSFDAIDKFLEFLQGQGCQNIPLPTNYRILEERNSRERKIKFLTPEEIQTLYHSTDKLFTRMPRKAAEPRRAFATLILDLCYGCGLRKSEAYNLLLEDIDFDKKILFVRQAKGYKDRYIPLNEKVSKRIELFIYQYRRAFNASHTRICPLTLHTLAYYFKTLLATSEINKQAGLHTLRHSIATHLLQNGMSIEQIAKFLGHSTLESTQVYTHLINEDE